MFNGVRASAGLIQPSRGVAPIGVSSRLRRGRDRQIGLICTQPPGNVPRVAVEQIGGSGAYKRCVCVP